jgi:predicted ATP-dependent endonuclease of OLD family
MFVICSRTNLRPSPSILRHRTQRVKPLAAILTYETIFAIEEPENFLHPLMQREILQIMRENVDRRGGHSFVIMTTHSETLLNAASPNEVVVVSIADGITHAKRPEDRTLLFAEIQRSGFGLGYAYVSGALVSCCAIIG